MCPDTLRAELLCTGAQNRENRINCNKLGVTLKCEPWSKKAGEKFLGYIGTFEPRMIQDGATPASSRKYSFLGLGDFRDFDFIATNAAGRRVGPVRTKNIFGNLKSSDSHLHETFDRIGIDSFFTENGALK